MAGVVRAARQARRRASAFRHHCARPEFALALQRDHGPRRARDLRVGHGARVPAAALSGDRSAQAGADSARHRSRGVCPCAAAGSAGARASRGAASATRRRWPAVAAARSRHPPERPCRCHRPARQSARIEPRCTAVDAGCKAGRARGLRRRTRCDGTRGRCRRRHRDQRSDGGHCDRLCGQRPGVAVVAQAGGVRAHRDRGTRGGRPVLGWAHGGVGELLRELQPAGLVPPFDGALLASKAHSLLALPPMPAVTMHAYRLHTMQESTLALYQSLVEA